MFCTKYWHPYLEYIKASQGWVLILYHIRITTGLSGHLPAEVHHSTHWGQTLGDHMKVDGTDLNTTTHIHTRTNKDAHNCNHATKFTTVSIKSYTWVCKACFTRQKHIECHVTERADNALSQRLPLPWGDMGTDDFVFTRKGIQIRRVFGGWSPSVEESNYLLHSWGQLVWVSPRCPWVILGEWDWERPCNFTVQGRQLHQKAEQQMTFFFWVSKLLWRILIANLVDLMQKNSFGIRCDWSRVSLRSEQLLSFTQSVNPVMAALDGLQGTVWKPWSQRGTLFYKRVEICRISWLELTDRLRTHCVSHTLCCLFTSKSNHKVHNDHRAMLKDAWN